MERRNLWSRFTRLFRVLFHEGDRVRDEYNMAELKKGRYQVAVAVLILYNLMIFYYLNQGDVNKTQFLSLFLAVSVLAGAGIGFVSCLNGTIPVADRWGGKLVFFIGLALMFLNGSMGYLSRYYFGRVVWFWDQAALSCLLYYGACGLAWNAWERNQEELETAEEEVSRKKSIKRYRLVGALAGLLFLFVALWPSWLGYQVYSDSVMGQAASDYEAAKEAEIAEKTTAEYTEYAALKEAWMAPEEYVMVYAMPLKPLEFIEEPVYERGGAVYVRTKEADIRVFFTVENGETKILESHRRDLVKGDVPGEKYYFVDGSWYSHEEFLKPHQAGDPAFALETTAAYQNYFLTRGRLPGAEESSEVTATEKGGLREVTFVYEEEDLEEARRWMRFMGIDPGEEFRQWETITADENGNPVEFFSYSERIKSEMRNFIKHKETEIDSKRSRYLTTDGDEARALYEEMIKQGPSVPEEARELYETMWGEWE